MTMPLSHLEQIILSGEHDTEEHQLKKISALSIGHALLVEVESALATSLPCADFMYRIPAYLEDTSFIDDDEVGQRLRISLAAVQAVCGHQNEARSSLLNLLDDAPSPSTLRYRILRELAKICSEQGNMDDAMSLYMRATAIARNLGDAFRQDMILFDIGRSYQYRGRNTSALEIFRALEQAIADHQILDARLSTYIARALLAQDKYDQAERYIDKALAYFSQSAPNSDYHVLALIEKARLVSCTDGEQDSFVSLRQAQQLAHDLGNEGLLARVRLAEGQILLEGEKSLRAFDPLQDAFDYFDENASPSYRIAAARALGRAHHKHRNMALAEKFFSIALSEARQKRLTKIARDTKGRMTSLSITESAIYTTKTIGTENDRSVPGYVLGKILGQGGFGKVYRAYETDQDRTVAIKLVELSRLYDTGARTALRQSLATEYEAASRVKHPGCVKIRAYGDTESGDLFVVQDFIDGPDLKKAMQTHLPRRKKLEVLVQIAQAVSALHDQDVVHRDLKPENILMQANRTPVLVDFGIAKLRETDSHFSGFGSMHYMAPEQYAGKKTDKAADWFSFGIIALTWLTNLSPLEISTRRNKLRRRVMPQKSYIAASNCPPQIAKSLYPLLTINPQRRLTDAADIIGRLRLMATAPDQGSR